MLFDEGSVQSVQSVQNVQGVLSIQSVQILSQKEGSIDPQEEEQDGDLSGFGSGDDLDETDVSFNLIGQVISKDL